MFKSMFNPTHRAELKGRLSRLDLEQPPLWGALTAPKMVTHLTDQMRLTLGEGSANPLPSPARYPIVRELMVYVLPWPKAKIKGPPEGFRTAPEAWERDLATLQALVDRTESIPPAGPWPDHPVFGAMSKRSWGVFCYRHFDHHLRQFGQ